MRRREFITLLGGAAVASPLAARSQPAERMRRVGVLLGLVANDPEGQARIARFQQALQQLGWIDGRNLRTDIRWGGGNVDDIRKYAAELVALAPDVILATASVSVGPLLQATRSVPIVFTNIAISASRRHGRGNMLLKQSGGACDEFVAARCSSITFQFCPRLFCPNPRVPPAYREEFVPAGLKQAHLPFQFLGALYGLEAVLPPVFPEKWWCGQCFVVNHRVDSATIGFGPPQSRDRTIGIAQHLFYHRAIAAELGVSDRTVNRARKATATHDAVDTRVGQGREGSPNASP